MRQLLFCYREAMNQVYILTSAFGEYREGISGSTDMLPA